MAVDLGKVVRYEKVEGVAHGQLDISPVFADPEAFAEAVEKMCQMFEKDVFDVVVAVDSAGVVLASAVASRTGRPLVVAGGKKSMILESDSETVQTHHGDVRYHMPLGLLREGQRAVVVCDVLYHGKDVLAAVNLAGRQGVGTVKVGAFVEHSAFDARGRALKGVPVESLVRTSDL